MTTTMTTKEGGEEESSKFYKMSPSHHHHHHHHDDEEKKRRSEKSLSLLLSSPSSSRILYKNFYIYVLIFLLHLSTVSSFAYQNRVHIASLGGTSSSSNSNINNNFNFGAAGGLGLVGSGDRQGCSWIKSTTTTNSNTNNNNNNNGDQLKKLECHLRTINVDLWNVNGMSAPTSVSNSNTNDGNSNNWTLQLSRQDFERAASIKLKCNDKLYFDSFLLPNQTLFSLINLRGVEIEHCKIRRLPGNVWTTLGFLKTLSITSHNSDWAPSVTLELENEAFEGLGQLEHLNLAYNNIFAIPERLFCPLRSLNKLNLSNNRLSELEELNWSSERGQYCTLGVQHVDLSFNSLRRLGKIVKWKKIQELRLQNNLIEELDDAAFGELSGLKMVNMSSNRLVAVPPSIFKYNGHLREIYLANNSISALAPAVFAGLEQLVLLDLSRNTLTSQWIRDKMFHGLSRLIVLRLSSNQLSYVDASIFKDLVSLQSLSLDNNRIETIHPDAFQSLHNLHLLLLTNNRITSIDSRVFSHQLVLRQLFLDHNKLRGLEDHLFVNCTSLQDLGLADNLLQEVPIALRHGLKSIQTLDIGENRITSLTNDSFSGLNSLFGLRMVDNRLTDLPRGFCDSLQKLRVLNLAQNRVQRISPSAFTNCQEIRALRLDTNMLEDLPNSLVPQLPNLLWLNVSENRLKSVDYRSIPVGTEWLDLSHNQIETITGFGDENPSGSASGIGSASASANNNNNNNNRKPIVPQLRVLDLSYNKLTSLDYTSFPASLDTLRVNHNKVTTVAPDTFIRSYNLRRVELVGNQMETLSLTSLRFPPLPRDRGLPEFYLGRNPWSCSCSMEWLIRANTNTNTNSNNNENTNNSPRIVDLDDITCTPVFSRNQSLISMRDHQIQSSDFLCPYSSHCFQLCYCCEYEACDCNMQCPDGCNCYHDFSWGRNVVDCSNANQVEVPANSPMDATEIYLDGNNIRELKSHAFIGKKHTRELFLNNSRIEFIRNKTFNGLKSLNSLHLEDNLLTELQGYEFADIENVRELYLGNNLIKSIAPETFTMLKSLEVLRLDGNLLTSVSVWELNGHGGLRSLSLSDNPWSCNCDFIIAFRSWIFSHSMIVKDLTLATCRMVTSSSDDKVILNNNNNNNNNVNTAISTICHGPSEKLVNNIGNSNFNINSVPSSSSSSVSSPGQFNVNDNILSDEHEHSEDEDHHDENGNVNSELSNSNSKSMEKVNVGGSDSGIFWTILVAVIGLLLILLVLVILFRKEIYDRVNSKVNLWLFFSSLCCCCGSCFRCCRDGGSGGRNDVKSKSKSKKSSSHHLSNGVGVGDDTEKLFDAYFLYGKRDEELILEKLTPELEHRVPNFFRLCLHYRDLCLNPQNPWNFEMVMSACDASKRVVLVLSQVFLQTEWNNPEVRASIQFVLSRPEVQKKLIIILLPPLTEHHLTAINFKLNTNHIAPDSLPLTGYPDLAMNININTAMANNNKLGAGIGIGIGASLLKSSILEYNTDPNFWSKFKLLLPTPLHSSMSHSADHPMLIPATYTISRHGDTYSSPDRHGHSQANSRNNLIPPSYETHSLNYANASSLHPLQNQHPHHLPNNPPPPPSLLWQTTAGLKDHHPNPHPNSIPNSTMTMPMPSQIQLQNRGVLPIPTAPNNGSNQMNPFPSFNESFRRHQQAHLNQQQHQHQQLRQAKRQSTNNNNNNNSGSSNNNSSSNSHHRHRNHNNHHNHHNNNHSHEHQNSNCSNISNNSRQPLHGSAGYSSSVETNLSSSNEELDHVYSTLDSPMHSPSAHHNGMNNFNSCRGPPSSQCNNCACSGDNNPASSNNINIHSTQNCTNGGSVNNTNNNNSGGVNMIPHPNPMAMLNNEQCNNKNNGGKLINPYSPTNINNNGDPTMYFV